MSSRVLGKLIKVDLRDAWTNEASDFTPWLANSESLRLLSETIGIELELEAQEKEVGPYRADILCRDTATDGLVLIENQLERTDHSHLGQLLTYAAGLNAATIVWVAQRFTDEHRAALDWLNERTGNNIRIFGLEIELWRIGDSSPAPKFNIVSEPNDVVSTAQDAIKHGEVSGLRQQQLSFWTAFRNFMEESKSSVPCTKPMPQGSMTHAIGKSGVRLASIASEWDTETLLFSPEIRAEVIVEGPLAKQRFAALEAQRAGIESDLGFALTWKNLDDRTRCRIYTRRKSDFKDQQTWPDSFAWLRQHLESLQKVFAPIVKSMSV